MVEPSLLIHTSTCETCELLVIGMVVLPDCSVAVAEISLVSLIDPGVAESAERICTCVPTLCDSMVTLLSALEDCKSSSRPTPGLNSTGKGSASVYVSVIHDVEGLPSTARPALPG